MAESCLHLLFTYMYIIVILAPIFFTLDYAQIDLNYLCLVVVAFSVKCM